MRVNGPFKPGNLRRSKSVSNRVDSGQPGTAWLGDDRGALMHAGNGPRHQVKIEPHSKLVLNQLHLHSGRHYRNAVAGQDSDQPLNRLMPQTGLIDE